MRPALLAIVVLLAACGADTDAPPPAAPTAPAADTTPATPAPAAALTDAQIVDILATANQVDSLAGTLAFANGSDSRVKQYGHQLTTDHTGANRAGAAVAASMGVAGAPNATSDAFRRDAARNRAVLERETGAEFDRVFLENEIEYHTMMLQAVDSTLLPAVTSPELRAHIQGIRPVVDAHLQQARQLRSALGGG
jgi:putative membrane protein